MCDFVHCLLLSPLSFFDLLLNNNFIQIERHSFQHSQPHSKQHPNNLVVKMSTIQVTVSSVDKSDPRKVCVVVPGSLSVQDAKIMILEHLRLAKTLSINEIVLLFRSSVKPHVKYASSPYSGLSKDWSLVLDDRTLESFLHGPSIIQFILLYK